MVPSFVRVPIKKTRSVKTAGFLCVMTEWVRFDRLRNRMTGDCSPVAVSYRLHCKNAANSAPQKLIRISQSDPCSIQMMRMAVTHRVMAVSDFCDIALASLVERR